jgi:hypothetical protein
MVASPKRLEPEKDCAGKGRQSQCDFDFDIDSSCRSGGFSERAQFHE